MNIMQKIIELSNELAADTIEIRRKIHQNPEISFQEFATSALIMAELDKNNITYEQSPVKPGIVAVIDSGKPGKLLMLRADMDALPIQEQTELPFKSQNDNVMHACGHDVHVANLLAVGRILNMTKDCWSGRVKLVFQPGEERGGGGRLMLEQGLMAQLPDACLGLHVLPIERGRFIIGTGNLSAYSDSCRIVVHGRATHSSAPQNGVDAINIAAAIIVNLNTILAKNLNPMECSTLNIGTISGGLAANIVPDFAEMRCMMRNISPEARETMKNRILSIATGTATALGGSCEVEFNDGYPAVFNDYELTAFVVDTLCEHAHDLYKDIGPQPLAADFIKTGNQVALIAEDFGFYSQQVPSCFVQVGTGYYAAAHNQLFDVDEEYIKLCTRSMALMAIKYLQQRTSG